MRENLTWGMMMLPESCEAFMGRHHHAFNEAQGSRTKHHNWKGGYLDHLDECFGTAALMYWPFSEHRTLPFSLQEVIMVMWLHDIEKVWKYSSLRGPTTWRYLAMTDKGALTIRVARECGLILMDEQWNALKYVHGEGDDYSPDKIIASPLAAFCHMCDYWSARGWPDEPRKSGQLQLRNPV